MALCIRMYREGAVFTLCKKNDINAVHFVVHFFCHDPQCHYAPSIYTAGKQETAKPNVTLMKLIMVEYESCV